MGKKRKKKKKKKRGSVQETGTSPRCTPYAAVADNLLSWPMLRKCAQKHIRPARWEKSIPFHNRFTPLPPPLLNAKVLSCMLMRNCVAGEDKHLAGRQERLAARLHRCTGEPANPSSYLDTKGARVYFLFLFFSCTDLGGRKVVVAGGGFGSPVNLSLCEITRQNDTITSCAISRLAKPNTSAE